MRRLGAEWKKKPAAWEEIPAVARENWLNKVTAKIRGILHRHPVRENRHL
jgi:hypothetical protein